MRDYLWCKVERTTFKGAWNLLVGVVLALVTAGVALLLWWLVSVTAAIIAAVVAFGWLLAGVGYCLYERWDYQRWVRAGRPRSPG